MKRCFTNILCADVDRTAQFYQDLLGLTRHYDSDWFVILTHPDLPQLEFGLLQRQHDIVPAEIAAAPAGMVITFVTDDVQTAFETAQHLGADILQEPTDMPYGQRRCLLRDPEGTVVDISAPIAR